MNNQVIKVNDKVELFNGKTAKVLSVNNQECVVLCKTSDGLSYERTFDVNQVKKIE